MKLLGRVIFATTVLLCFSTLTWAEPDPPGRVARLQYVQGSVSVQPRGTEDWVAATVNRPLTTSDNMWVDKDSRAELNVGTGVLRMNSETSVTLTNVSDSTVQVQLNQGTLNLRVRRLYRGEIYEVDTPNMAFTVQKSGQYRFDVGASGDATLVTVWQGEGDATGNGPAVRVRAHRRARFTGGTSLAHEIYEAPPFDGFDDWCRVRDRREDHAVSARYVSPGVIGYADLDDYGDWRVLPTYGPVWVPVVVAPGWAPYHYGRWVWVSPWGWTWVDDAPWGFAPFHYGRWIYTTGYWAWVPGPVYVRPVYAPALVAWFGGSNFSIGISFGGGYGWCPLGYGEPFIPWYGSSRNYFQRVNITNTRITNITYITNNYYDRDRDRDRDHRKPAKDFDYANLKAPGAVTAVPHHAIENSLPVAKAAIPVSPKEASELRSAWLRGNVDLAPTRESRLGDGAGRTTSAPPEKIFARPVVTKLTPPVTPQLQPKGASADKQPDRAVPTRIAEKENPVMRPDRVIPRPPQQPREVNVDVEKPAAAPRPPAADNSEVRSAQPGLARVVPRPPDRNGVESATPAATSSPDGSRPGDRPHVYTTLPAVRAVPRPSDSPASENRATAGPSVGVRPHDADDSRPASMGNNNVPRPNGPVAPPKGLGPDEHPARITPESGLPRSNNNDDVPRPSGPIAPPNGVGPDKHPAPIAPSSAPPQGNYGESPRSYGGSPSGGSPSSMAAPAAPPATRTAPQPAPAPRDNSPTPNRGSPPSSNAATPNAPRDR